jgi:multimeric flavodoxin WrbA
VNKIIILVGTNRLQSQCNCYKTAVLVKERLNGRNADNQVGILCLADCKIDLCKGCEACLETGGCVIQDDMKVLKTALMEADHIMIVTSVYAYHIPAALKNVIDRISYWMHTLNGLGKTSSSLLLTSTDGQVYASDYLEKTLQRLGTIYAGGVEITSDKPPMWDMDAMVASVLIEQFVNKVEGSLTGAFSLDNLETQIQSFGRYKEVYSKPEAQDYKGSAWKTSPALLHNTFLDAWQSRRMNKRGT